MRKKRDQWHSKNLVICAFQSLTQFGVVNRNPSLLSDFERIIVVYGRCFCSVLLTRSLNEKTIITLTWNFSLKSESSELIRSLNQTKCWFLLRGESQRSQGKTSQGEPTNSKHIHGTTPSQGIGPGEGRVLTTDVLYWCTCGVWRMSIDARFYKGVHWNLCGDLPEKGNGNTEREGCSL